MEYHSGNASLVYNPLRTEKVKDVETGVETTVEKGNELMKGAIYGGNNSERRTIFGRINIDVPVRQDSYKYGMTTATVYGAGYGPKTWSEYTAHLSGRFMVAVRLDVCSMPRVYRST